MTKVDWSKLHTQHGPATQLPKLLKQLASKDSTTREHAFDDLHRSLVGDGRWCSASAPSVGYLLDQIAKAPRPDYSAVLAADVAAADVARLWLSDDTTQLPPEVAFELRERVPALLQWLRSPKAALRAAAALLLLLDPDAPGVVEALQQAESTEPHPFVHAALLLTLARLRVDRSEALMPDQRLRELADGGTGIVQGAAGLCLLRMNSNVQLGELGPSLRAWLGWRPAFELGESLVFFEGLSVAYFVRAVPAGMRFLLRFARHRGLEASLEEWLLQQKDREPGPVLASVGAGLLDLSLLLERPLTQVVEATELSPAQRELLTKLGDSMSIPLACHGLPAAGYTRARWLGAAVPGPLERVTDGKPNWTWFRDEFKPGQDPPVPERLARTLVGADRLESVAQRAGGAYGGAQQIKPENLERELEQIGSGADVLARIESTADDIARRMAAALAHGAWAPREFAVHGFLVLPWLRAGRALKPEWEVLFFLGAQPQVRESFELLPRAQRVSVLLSVLAVDHGPATQPLIENVIGVLDLARDAAVLEALGAKVNAVHPALRDEVARRIEGAKA